MSRPDWCQGADSVCHYPACTCVIPDGSRRPRKEIIENSLCLIGFALCWFAMFALV